MAGDGCDLAHQGLIRSPRFTTESRMPAIRCSLFVWLLPHLLVGLLAIAAADMPHTLNLGDGGRKALYRGLGSAGLASEVQRPPLSRSSLRKAVADAPRTGKRTGKRRTLLQDAEPVDDHLQEQCWKAGSAFDKQKPECNCFGSTKHGTASAAEYPPGLHPVEYRLTRCTHALSISTASCLLLRAAEFDQRPTIKVITGNWPAANVDAQLLKIVLEEARATASAVHPACPPLVATGRREKGVCAREAGAGYCAGISVP